MIGLFKSDDEFRAMIRDAVEDVVTGVKKDAAKELAGFRTAGALQAKITALREETETMRIEKARKEEEFARREREVEHKVGLERKRQEFEIDQAKREATVKVKTENLAADKTRFEEQMKFHEERFTREVQYLHEMMAKVLERLPTAEIIANFDGRKVAANE